MKLLYSVSVVAASLLMVSCNGNSLMSVVSDVATLCENLDRQNKARSSSSYSPSSYSSGSAAYNNTAASSYSDSGYSSSGTYSARDYIAAQNRSVAALRQLAALFASINDPVTATRKAPQVQAVVDEYRRSLLAYKQLPTPTGATLEAFKRHMIANKPALDAVGESVMDGIIKMTVKGFYNSTPLQRAVMEYRSLR